MALRFRREEYTGIALIVAGFVLVGLVLAGYGVGFLIDRRAGTAPYGTIIGLIIGFLVGFWDLYVIASRILARQPAITPAPPKDDTAEENAGEAD